MSGRAQGVAPDGHRAITYSDSQSFDTSLSDALGTQAGTVEVTVNKGFRVSDLPERVDGWMYALRRSGGAVSRVQIPYPTPILLRAGKDESPLTVSPLGMNMDGRNGMTAGYNVTLYHYPDGGVERLVFTRGRNGDPRQD
ncbi:MAG: hypothetical protein HQL86_04995 [Magnetococcales bacterium]|nr:hypothetical protein [Magnetococcales bacterium]